ncbi:hypothetical protein [Desulfococcus multivorans]|uniref:Uncharacterized protein n=1 Tax=Desulfococcus multivorans DSM 2059 TaxID=1121405 RepID=S7UPM1_DESML|nr:hypothetical protein [Desulfococcus multivorans]AOY59977.1 conserved uncharacterized protein [Desulfococcus multivorans]AQV02124.1 hypothetical protein B2D07_16055 [Desulfococcus multivorans]EPR35974.1 hypothetical protein dsmv_0679 [Desulfococcus multivorans DSM 2059]SJZ36078.1 hypothetical protein SAMN02745446_00197 [Desulfococcus multivorans DSM 2059]
MLFLKPPYLIIEGVAVFPDHANERQFYYLPAMPRISTVFDPTVGPDGAQIPQISLIRFRDAPQNGGFLTFQVDLGIDRERLDTIAAEYKRITRLRDNPIPAPVILENGTVQLIILGETTPPPPAAGRPPAPPDDAARRFVLRINPPYAAKPALYGDNQAIFSVELDQDGVQLIETALFQGELMPVGVIYALDFFALRPAFTVKVSADWDRVQTHFEESFGFDYLFSSVEIDNVVDKLIEDRVIRIDVDSFLPEGEDAGSWVGRRDQAVNDFKDMVLESFFAPSIEPVKEEEDGWDKFTHTAERLSLLAATGGWGGVTKFSYKRIDYTRVDQKRINLTMNERVSVKRSIYPQANLRGLGQPIRDLITQGLVDPSRFLQSVTLNDPWFQKRQVKAHALVNFDNDSVEALNLTLKYGSEPKTLRLTRTEASGRQEWNSIIAGGMMQRDVAYQYRVLFKNVDTAERPGIIDSGTLTTQGDEFDLSPRGEGLYFIDEIQFGADLLPWERFPNVSIEVRYTDDQNDIHLAETFLLTRARPEATWKRFRLDAALDGYQVRIGYLAADHRDIHTGWQTTNQELFLIRDPRPTRRTVQVIPAVSWELASMVIVEMTYVDEANGVEERQTLSFFNTDQDRLPKTFTANLVDPENRLVGYTAAILLKDNRLINIPSSTTAASAIFIRTDMIGHRIVTVQPAQVNFAANGILRMEADLNFADDGAGLSFADSFTFWSPGETGFFEYDYTSAERNKYTCKARLVMANGLVRERDLGLLNGDRLILPAA